MSKRFSGYISKGFNVDLNRVKIGGNYAAMQDVRQKMSAKQRQIFSPERTAIIQSLKDQIKDSHYYWLLLCENYESHGLSGDEYFEIAKYAIDLYPGQMNRLRDDKLTNEQYFEICKVSFVYGKLSFIKFDKLSEHQVAYLRVLAFLRCGLTSNVSGADIAAFINNGLINDFDIRSITGNIIMQIHKYKSINKLETIYNKTASVQYFDKGLPGVILRAQEDIMTAVAASIDILNKKQSVGPRSMMEIASESYIKRR